MAMSSVLPVVPPPLLTTGSSPAVSLYMPIVMPPPVFGASVVATVVAAAPGTVVAVAPGLLLLLSPQAAAASDKTLIKAMLRTRYLCRMIPLRTTGWCRALRDIVAEPAGRCTLYPATNARARLLLALQI